MGNMVYVFEWEMYSRMWVLNASVEFRYVAAERERLRFASSSKSKQFF